MTSEFNVNYTFENNQITIASKYRPDFQIRFMLICFLSPLLENPPYELGNIETFLCNDSYYPYTSIGKRYSYIQHYNYVQNTENCVRAPVSETITLNISGDPSPPWVAFLNGTGTVRGPKAGIIANTTYPQYSSQYVKNVIEKVKSEWDSRSVSPGTIEAMIPDLLMHKTQCLDEESVINENRTIYDNLGPDPRNPLDPTRNKGLFPKCSSTSCSNSEFRSKFNGQNYRLHDRMFRVKLLLELADRVLSKPYCQ